MGRCPRVSGDAVGAGEDLNVPGATAHLDPLADERKRNGVRPSLERDGAVGADAPCDGDVERLWHRLGKRAEVRARSQVRSTSVPVAGHTRGRIVSTRRVSVCAWSSSSASQCRRYGLQPERPSRTRCSTLPFPLGSSVLRG